MFKPIYYVIPTITVPLNGDFTILCSLGFLMSMFNSTKCVHVYVAIFLLGFQDKCPLARAEYNAYLSRLLCHRDSNSI